jgi:Dehydrogenases with different specificities (related to short-chain alcohol dehydrogenases)
VAWRNSEEKNQLAQSLKGKTALVTGASRGIGRAIAERLAKDGATVALTYNASKSSADEAVAAIEKAGGSAFAIHADLANPATVPALFERLDDEFTKRTGSKALDILVNNAGNSGWVGFKDATPESWDTLMAVYARAPFFIIQAALDRLADGGRIINISSAAATKPVTAAPVYSMAKAAINTLTHALAIELGPRGITANAVAPGFTRTDANADFRKDPELVKTVESQIALGRFGEPSEIAAVVAFLASDDGHWVTGQTIEASGGYKL